MLMGEKSTMVRRGKFKAFGIHFFITTLVALAVAVLVFKLWYPPPFSQMMGGVKLFTLLAVCDLVLGPVISLIIYNPRKTRKQLFTDYLVVAAVQMAAFVYGLHMVSSARPAFLVFTADRYVVVNTGELPEAERAQAQRPEWRKSNWFGGYYTVYVQRPTNPNDAYDLMMSSLGGGRDLQHVVQNYRSVAEHIPDVLHAAQPVATLRERFAGKAQAVDAAVMQSGGNESELRWLPMQAGSVFWTVLIDAQTALPVAWVNLDPL